MNIPSSHFDKASEMLKKFNAELLIGGEKTYKEGAVNFISNSEVDYYLTIHGTSKSPYLVRVTLGERSVKGPTVTPLYNCTCPYFKQNSTCKHVVAALFFIVFKNPKNQPALKSELAKIKKNKIPTIPTEQPNQFKIRPEELDRITEIIPDLPTKDAALPAVKKFHFFPDGITYLVFLGGYQFDVAVTYKKKEKLFKINFSSQLKNKTPEIYAFLRNRFSENYRDQDFLTEEIIRKTQKKFLEQKNLLAAVKTPENCLTIDLNKDKLTFAFTGELEGMRDAEVLGANLNQLLPGSDITSYIEKLKESEHAKESGKYNVGLVFYFPYGRKNALITPILGKGKKIDEEGIYTKIDILDNFNDHRIQQKEGLQDLMNLVSRYNKISDPNDEEAWQLIVSIVNQAKNRPLYLSLSSDFHYGRISARDLDQRIYPKETTAKMKLVEGNFFYSLEVNLVFDEKEYPYNPSTDDYNLSIGVAFFKYKLLYFSNLRHYEGVKAMSKMLPLKFPKNQLDIVIRKIIKPMSSFLPFDDQRDLLSWSEAGDSILEELYITELGGLIAFIPKVVYGETTIDLLDPTLVEVPETGEFLIRNQDAEQSFLAFLLELHPSFELVLPKFLFTLPATEFAKGTWFLETYEKLKSRGVKTFGLENIKIKRYSPFPAKVATQFTSSQDWFGVKSDISFGKETFQFSKIRKSWENGEKFVQLGDGSLGKIPDVWMKKMMSLLRAGEVDGEEVRISKIHFMLMEDWEDSPEFTKVQLEVEEKKRKMAEFVGINEVAVPAKVKAELRPYQKTGLNWLNFLRDFNWGGILADDMGLGKTLQLITLISQMEEQNPKIKVLIVAPTTLLFNWKKELEKFAPHLDFWVNHGQRYETIEELSKHQLVLTSYGLVINDLEILQKIEWDLIVADESQAIKNTSSLRYKAMLRLKGKQKIALTGTPIENGIQELYAQINFTNPGFFKTFNHFSGNFLTPIKKGDTDVVESLKKQITPFVLRRTKKEVLTELPEKIEEFLYCEMGPHQRAIYEAKREEYKNFLLKKFSEDGAEQSKMFVLEGLTRLRQICDSPKLTGDSDILESAKIELLQEHILEKTGNHKLLVFSQFVKMLELIREKLDKNGIPYCYLDGQTSLAERERQVQKFQENEEVRVFLISLKAGGTGLNLTAADYVYIVDPWWNPAVENQAIDRCYRMGQEKHVMAYRMICQNTIEEKIMELQSAKSKLAKDIIGEGEGILASMNREAMLELFS